MTIEQQTHYFGGKFSTPSREVVPGTVFTWVTEFEDGPLVQKFYIKDHDTIEHIVDPEIYGEGKEIKGDYINFLQFPQVKTLNWLERLIKKDAQFYWRLTPGTPVTLEPEMATPEPGQLLRWE
ncbi:MAG: hypothetical protein Q7T54_00520 [Candidatus Levybacteria bacterium]|nr:hypothetical protein [Candidatus Levybacteria bacterium]